METTMSTEYLNGRKPSANDRATEFLSRGFESLAHWLQQHDSDENRINDNDLHFDLVIVGSGYGGAIAALEFSKTVIKKTGKKPRICILERGKERLPGSFPSSLAELPTEVRLYRHSQENNNSNQPTVLGTESGLFDIRVGDGCSTLLANGLGGGSLINAGVMLQPDASVFDSEKWPDSFREKKELSSYFSEAQELLGASIKNEQNEATENTITRSGRTYSKYKSLETLVGCKDSVKAVPITVKLNTSDPDQTIKTDNCIDCGDCFSGCNFNAKKSLDTNVLATAALYGVKIFCSTTVHLFDKLSDGRWELLIKHTEKNMHKHFPKTTKLRCSKLIIAAGTFGTTELLLQSQLNSENNLSFSSQLGNRFTGNGDMLITISNRSNKVNSVASEKKVPGLRNVGPTITGMIDYRNSECHSVAIQELSVPAILHRLTSESTTLSQTISSITSNEKADILYSDEFCTLEPCGPLGKFDDQNKPNAPATKDGRETEHISILALMGNDKQTGTLSLPKYYSKVANRKNAAPTQGTLDLKFSPDSDFYKQNTALINHLTSKNDPKAWVHDNPVWKPLGTSLEDLFGVSIPGMLVTVHPLGGCPIGIDAQEGVVDEYGRAYDTANHSNYDTHDGLAILDGSILPTPTGINPALTIATLSLRASRKLIEEWGWSINGEKDNCPTPLSRPRFKQIDPLEEKQKTQTTLELVERLIGCVTLKQLNGTRDCVVELRLRSEPFIVEEFTRFLKRDIPLLCDEKIDPGDSLPSRSTIRIFDKLEWDKHHDIVHILEDRRILNKEWKKKKRAVMANYHEELDKLALFIAPLSGSINLLEEVPTSKNKRILRALWAWFLNRGFRDIRQYIGSSIRSYFYTNKNNSTKKSKGFFRKYKELLAVFANTGRERRLSYNLKIDNTSELRPDYLHKKERILDSTALVGKKIKGHKIFRYKICSNPWRQLMDIELTDFPCIKPNTSSTLTVDPEYFAKNNSPLLHISSEDNAVDGYADLLAVYTHAFRLFILQQLWTLRKPDTRTIKDNQQATKINNRLPRELCSTSNLEFKRFPLNLNEINKHQDQNPPVEVLLTRYRLKNRQSQSPPVLCIHGYSASGTTFAHSTLYGGKGKKGGLAAYLADNGREVWVLDMRSSCALSGGTSPWTFEDMAFKDIPLAISQVCKISGHSKVDVVTHCMGGVMLSMTLLGEPKNSMDRDRTKNTHNEIRNIALSQAGPFLKFTSANTLRAYVLNYVRKLMPKNGFEFSPSDPNSQINTLLDRLLYTIPYTDKTEYKAENPLLRNTYWVRARHRMDALYGRAFNLRNMHSKTLKNIDDFFGPMSFQTLEQTLWLSKRKQLSDWEGHSYHLKKQNFTTRWNHPTLWIHGEKNGLIDPISPSLTALICDEQNLSNFKFKIIADMGHQDCLMGKNCEVTFRAIAEHLNEE